MLVYAATIQVLESDLEDLLINCKGKNPAWPVLKVCLACIDTSCSNYLLEMLSICNVMRSSLSQFI